MIKSSHDPSGKVGEKILKHLKIDDGLIIGSFFAPFMAKMLWNDGLV